jgi:hypothetical protein
MIPSRRAQVLERIPRGGLRNEVVEAHQVSLVGGSPVADFPCSAPRKGFAWHGRDIQLTLVASTFQVPPAQPGLSSRIYRSISAGERGCSPHVSRGHLEPAIASRSNHAPCASSYGFAQSTKIDTLNPASGATLPIELNDSSTRSHSTFRVPQIEAKQCSSASSAPALSDRDARARRPLRWN